MRLDLTQKVGITSQSEVLKQRIAAEPTVTTNVAEKAGLDGEIDT